MQIDYSRLNRIIDDLTEDETAMNRIHIRNYAEKVAEYAKDHNGVDNLQACKFLSDETGHEEGTIRRKIMKCAKKNPEVNEDAVKVKNFFRWLIEKISK